jgi:hypothetical protein
MIGIFQQNRQYLHARWLHFAATILNRPFESSFAIGGVLSALRSAKRNTRQSQENSDNVLVDTENALRITHLVSEFRRRWHFKYHKILWSFGTNSETANASNCHPCRNTNVGGLALHWSMLVMVEGGIGGTWATVGDPAVSHANSDCEAHNNNCWKHKYIKTPKHRAYN